MESISSNWFDKLDSTGMIDCVPVPFLKGSEMEKFYYVLNEVNLWNLVGRDELGGWHFLDHDGDNDDRIAIVEAMREEGKSVSIMDGKASDHWMRKSFLPDRFAKIQRSTGWWDIIDLDGQVAVKENLTEEEDAEITCEELNNGGKV